MFNAGSDFLMASISPTCGDNLTSQKRLYLTAISFLRMMRHSISGARVERMSNLKQRLLSWMHGHVFAGDLIITLVIGVLLFGVTGSITYNPGLLFDLKPSTQMAWEAAMLIPLLIRRWWPQTGALLCVALTLAHLIFGPCLLGADILALFMLYSVIVYGNPKNTKAFIILALTIGLLASALVAWTMTNGPLLTGGKVHTWSSWNDPNPNGVMVTEDTLAPSTQEHPCRKSPT